MSIITKEEILNLSVSERILLVEDIWDSIAMVPDAVQLSDDQKSELDQRLESYRDNPEAGSQWETVRERIRNRR